MNISPGEVVRWFNCGLLLLVLSAPICRAQGDVSPFLRRGGDRMRERIPPPSSNDKATCTGLGFMCGGMGAPETQCCEGLVCKEQDAFFSGCIDAKSPLAKQEPSWTTFPQTSIEVKSGGDPQKTNYAQVLYLSILFFEAQRSGRQPPTNRIPWRGDSALTDRGLKGEDLTGGWYDSGCLIKFGLPMAWTTTVLTWGLLQYGDAYHRAGEYDRMLDSIRWPLDYFIKAHASPDELYVQVGDQAEQAYWGPPETMATPRTPYRVTCANPGTEPVAETAAAMAAGFLAFNASDPGYAETLLLHAEQLFDFGYRCQGNYIVDGRLSAAEPFYFSYSGYKDELAWAGLWLYKATGNTTYLQIAKDMYPSCCEGPNNSAFTWDDKSAGVQVLMYMLTGDPFYSAQVSDTLNSWIIGRARTPRGLSYYTWAPNKFAAGASLLALIAADLGLNVEAYRAFAKSQIHYMMGSDGSSSTASHSEEDEPPFSFIIGYGKSFPRAPHHRASSCPSRETNSTCRCSTAPNFYTLYGALVGGPNMDDTYADACPDFQKNEVCVACQAAFQSAVAGLKHVAMTSGLAH